tara:strand:- start:1349 stop:1693 length:345 start_codon:yes stop_codon:yes gene_type:complete
MANNFKNAFATSVSTTAGSPTDVYTANNGSACNSILIELDISNTGTSAVQVTVLILDSSASASFHIIKNAPLPVGSSLKVVSGQKVVLNGNDKVRVYASANTVDVVASILEDVS